MNYSALTTEYLTQIRAGFWKRSGSLVDTLIEYTCRARLPLDVAINARRPHFIAEAVGFHA